MTVTRPDPTLAECRQAARRLRAAPHRRRAVDSVRPRGVTRLFRGRAPLTLPLYTAGLEEAAPHSGFPLTNPVVDHD